MHNLCFFEDCSYPDIQYLALERLSSSSYCGLCVMLCCPVSSIQSPVFTNTSQRSELYMTKLLHRKPLNWVCFKYLKSSETSVVTWTFPLLSSNLVGGFQDTPSPGQFSHGETASSITCFSFHPWFQFYFDYSTFLVLSLTKQLQMVSAVLRECISVLVLPSWSWCLCAKYTSSPGTTTSRSSYAAPFTETLSTFSVALVPFWRKGYVGNPAAATGVSELLSGRRSDQEHFSW